MDTKNLNALRMILLALLLISLTLMTFLYFRSGSFDYLNVFFVAVLFVVYLTTKRKAT